MGLHDGASTSIKHRFYSPPNPPLASMGLSVGQLKRSFMAMLTQKMKPSQLQRGHESCRPLLLPNLADESNACSLSRSGLPPRPGLPTAGLGCASTRSPLGLDVQESLSPECVTVLMWHPQNFEQPWTANSVRLDACGIWAARNAVEKAHY